VLALRGDPPGGPSAQWEAHPSGLTYASELVQLVRSLGDFSVGVAAFPDKHPSAPDLESDARRLVEKSDAGADFAITQFFFNADAYFRLRDRVVAMGCDMPILPGIMPVTQTSSITRMAEMSGAVFPPELASRLAEAGDDNAAVRSIGVEVASDLATRLLAGGAPGVHFYTMNRSTATRDVFASLGHHTRGLH
jgi:methylenetetrahydrofolate reductase (NADPH)